jgi:hypothetical protein
MALASARDEPQRLRAQLDAERLIALADACCAAEVARRVLVLWLSRLPADLARAPHRRLARAALAPLERADRAQSFVLPSGDIAVAWRGSGAPALQDSLDAVAHLFAGSEEVIADPAALCEVLDLPADAHAIRAIACSSRATRADPQATDAPAAGVPLDTASLTELEITLAQTDMARFVRRRPVCEYDSRGRFQRRWETRYLSVEEIASVLAPGRALQAEPWLFRRLTRTFDRRMLALLAAPAELRDAGPFGLNLNIASILAPEFLRFDAALPVALRGEVTLELLAVDILADLPAFVFARDFAHARGYRLLLRAGSSEVLTLLPPGRLGVDLVRLRWSPTLAEHRPNADLGDPAHLVLGHADTPQALGWGRQHGILLFQGRCVSPTAGRTRR